MATTTCDTIRTFETFEVRWIEEGRVVSTWTNYTREGAEALVRSATREGVIVRREFEVRVPADLRHLYRGTDYIAERPA